MSRYWWAFAARGCLALLFVETTLVWPPLALFIWPEESFRILAVLFGGFVVADAILSLMSVGLHGHGRRLWRIGLPAVALALGIAAGLWPDPSMPTLAFFFGAWTTTTGLNAIATDVAMKGEVGTWWLTLGGLLSVFMGIALTMAPEAPGLPVWIAAYCAAAGILFLVTGTRLRGLRLQAEPEPGRVLDTNTGLVPDSSLVGDSAQVSEATEAQATAEEQPPVPEKAPSRSRRRSSRRRDSSRSTSRR